MTELFRDVRLAVRTLLAARGFTAVVVLTLGLGLALSAAALITVNAYLLSNLPYPGAERLYSVRYAEPGVRPPENLADLDWTTLDGVIEHHIAWDLDMFYLIGGTHAEAAPGAWVTPGFMEGLGVHPALGRGFDPAEFVPGSPQVALISHRLWQSRFGADPQVVGRTFRAYASDRPDEAETFTIVGVLPAGFWHLNAYTDVLTPLRAPTYPYMVRAREGRTAADIAAAIGALVRPQRPQLPESWEPDVRSAHGEYVERMQPVLRAVGVAAAIVLLIAWANVAGLLLIRGAKRRRELAIRLTLGAGRFSIVRLLLVEALVLGAAAVGVGLLAGAVIVQSIGPLIERELGRRPPSALEIDSTVVAVSVGVGLLLAVGAGLGPLAAIRRWGLQGTLQTATRTATEGGGAQPARRALIVLQVAGSVALLTAGTLMLRSVSELLRVDFGIDARQVLTTSLTLRLRAYPDEASRAAVFERLQDRVAAVPGITRAALASGWPLQDPAARELLADAPQRVSTTATVATVSAGYFETLGMPMIAGRGVEAGDRAGSEPVAVISETLARRIAAGGRALDARISILPPPGARNAPPTIPRRVVGIVRDVRKSPTDPDLADVYVPLAQSPGRSVWMYTRTEAEPSVWIGALREAVREVDPEISLADVRSLQDAIDQQLSRPAFLAWLLSGFAFVAAALSLVGVYGVIAYAVRQREREIAVRMAIGASPASITRLFLRQGGLVVCAGLLIGVPLALAAGRVLETQLFGIRPGDPWSLGLTVAAFGLAGLAAVWWPARRAAGADPAVALKVE